MSEETMSEEATSEEATSEEATSEGKVTTFKDFSQQLESTFVMPFEDGPDLELKLTEASEMGGTTNKGKKPFALIFRGPPEPALVQSTYTMQHDVLGSLFVFLVPVQSDAEGTDYEAVFT